MAKEKPIDEINANMQAAMERIHQLGLNKAQGPRNIHRPDDINGDPKTPRRMQEQPQMWGDRRAEFRRQWMQEQPQMLGDRRAEFSCDQGREARGDYFQQAAHVLHGTPPLVRPMANSMEIMTQPVCLIENDPDGSLHIVDDSLKILQQIEQPVVVISVVGLYRTGKSYLMNKLAGKHKGFALGNTVESKTKGIWMWCVPHPTKPDHTLVLLDTEGLGDVDKGDEKHDTWIFCLAVLLSSTLVYNSMGTIDNSALEKLHYVTELTEHINVKSSPGEDLSTQFMRVFPSFIWAVRDFSLDLEINGETITADQYLENALKLKTGNSAKIQKHNMPRECLLNFFCVHKCFVFIRPTNEKKMKMMEDLEDEELEPNFVAQATEFCNYIFSNAKAKTMNGDLKLTGRLFGILADMYVKAIESGLVPCLDNAVVELAQIQNSRAMTEALEHYQREMSQRVSYPTETLEELSEVHSAAEKEAVRIFIDISFKDEDQKKQLELMEKLCSMYSQMCGKNMEESLHACKNIIKRVFAPLEKKLSDGHYLRTCGHTEYSIDLKELISRYRSEGGRGIKSEDVLAAYLEEKEVIGKTILAADESFSATERISKLQSEKNKVQEQKLKAVEEQNRILHQALEDQKRIFDENMKQLEKKLKADAQREMKELERVLKAKMKVKMNLMEHGFKKKAEDLDREIKALQEKKEDNFSTLKAVLDTFGTAAGYVIPNAKVVTDLFGFVTNSFKRK